VACLPIFFTGHVINRWEGAVFLAYYVAYLVHIVLAAQGHPGLGLFHQIMAGYLLPLTALTLAVLAFRHFRGSRAQSEKP